MYDLQVVAPRVRGAVKARKRRCAPVAQLDRAPGFEPVGRGFKSLRARQQKGSDDCQSLVVFPADACQSVVACQSLFFRARSSIG